MAPAGDMGTEESKAQSFSLANIVPQNPQNNQRTWGKIESDTRKYVMRATGDVYVFTGPVYGDSPPTIGKGKVGYLSTYSSLSTTPIPVAHGHTGWTTQPPPDPESRSVMRNWLKGQESNSCLNVASLISLLI